MLDTVEEVVVLVGALLAVVALLAIPAEGREAIRRAVDLVVAAFGAGGGERGFVLDVFVSSLKASLITFALTSIGAVVCVGLAVALGVLQEVRGSGEVVRRVLGIISALPAFVPWIFLIGVGRLFDPPISMVLADRAVWWQKVVFWASAIGLISITNGSFLVASNSVREEMSRLRLEPFAIAARLRGLAGWRFHLRHLVGTAASSVAERIGGILGSCVLVEYLMNIPGMGWVGITAFHDFAYRYAIQWVALVLLAVFFLRFVRGVSRSLRRSSDARLRQPA